MLGTLVSGFLLYSARAHDRVSTCLCSASILPVSDILMTPVLVSTFVLLDSALDLLAVVALLGREVMPA